MHKQDPLARFRDPQHLDALLHSRAPPTPEELKRTLLGVVRAQTSSLKRTAVMFSGGVDSCVVAKAVSRYVDGAPLYTCGLKGAPVMQRASKAAKALGLPLREIVIPESELPALRNKVADIIGTEDKLQVEIALPQYLTLRAMKKDGFSVVFAGQGADELFGGYDEFRKASAEGPGAVKALVKEKLEGMHERNGAREEALCKALEIELRAPCLEPEFINIALGVPSEELVHGKGDFTRKHAWRALAVSLGVPEEFAMARKKAMQYDSGVAAALKKHSRN